MDIKQLELILDTYGCRQSDWPEQERKQAVQLIQDSSQAALLYDAAKTVDDQICSWKMAGRRIPPLYSQQLFTQIDVGANSWVAVLSPWPPKLALMVSSVFLGIYLGMSIESIEAQDDYLDTLTIELLMDE